jgi:hypothetical protein
MSLKTNNIGYRNRNNKSGLSNTVIVSSSQSVIN